MGETPLNQVKLIHFSELQLIRTLHLRVNYRTFVAKVLGRIASFTCLWKAQDAVKSFLIEFQLLASSLNVSFRSNEKQNHLILRKFYKDCIFRFCPNVWRTSCQGQAFHDPIKKHACKFLPHKLNYLSPRIVRNVFYLIVIHFITTTFTILEHKIVFTVQILKE